MCYNNLRCRFPVQNNFHRGIAQLVEQRSPKPRAEGSSPSAPAINFWLRKAISEAFLLLILPKILPSLCDVQIYGAVESVNCRFLCGLAAVDINSLGGVYAFVTEQNGNVLNRYAVVVENTRHRMAKAVNCTMR